MSVDGCGHVQLGDDFFVAAHHGVPAGKRAIAVAGLLLAGVIAVVVLLWAKWLPYAAKATGVANSHAWVGSNIIPVGGVAPGDAPSVHAAFTFTQAYGLAVWQALVAALLIGAAVQTLIPRTWLLRVLNRRGLVAGAVVGGLASTPSRCVHAALRRWRPRCGAAGCPPRRPWPTGWAIRCSTPRWWCSCSSSHRGNGR